MKHYPDGGMVGGILMYKPRRGYEILYMNLINFKF